MAEKPRRPRDDDDDEVEAPRPKKKPRPPADDDVDDYDDAPQQKKRKRSGVETLIPYKNGMALAAYYCGVFSLIPIVGFLLGPVAIVLGILGIAKARQAKKQAGGMGHAIAGIILGIAGIIAWPIVGLAMGLYGK